MSVWYDCGNGMVRTNMARCALRAPVFLACPGPSLRNAPKNLVGPGRFVMALNTAYPTVRPDMWMGLDAPACYSPDVFREPFPKFFRGGYQNRQHNGVRLRDMDGAHFLDLQAGTISDIFTRRAHDTQFLWQKNTFGTALHFLVWLGAKEIHLLGCDMGGPSDYCDDRVLAPEQHKRNRRLYSQQVNWSHKFVEQAKQHGITVYSATPDSPLNAFMDYVPAEETLQRIDDFGKVCRKPLYCTDAHIVTPDITVACVLKSGGDFTPEYVRRLRDNVANHLTGHRFVCLSDVPVPCERIPLHCGWPGWWSKIELFRELKAKTLYLDLDTIVNGSLESLKTFGSGFAMLRDLGKRDNLASGVMLWDGDHSELYSTFCEDPEKHMALHAPPKYPWGDQAFISKNHPGTVTALQDVLPDLRVASHKYDTVEARAKASIVCYHGKPRPHETGWQV